MDWRTDMAKYYVNLSHRPDRNEHMKKMLASVGLEAERLEAIRWQECNLSNPKLKGMINRGTLGAIGCHLSQEKCMGNGLAAGKDVWVMEDDTVLCSDIKERLDIIQDFCNSNEWDVVFLGGTVHIPGQWHSKGHHNPELKPSDCNCSLGVDIERTTNKFIFRVYGAWSTYSYIVNKNSIEKILSLFQGHLHTSIGIDWLFIKLAPQLKIYMFLPGSCKQYDNQSNIGEGETIFSAFKSLGEYWFQDKMQSFDHSTLKI